MARYGANPYGEPLWRVVYAPSVKKIVGGQFPDGFTGYRARKAYPHLGGWIVEKWISAFELTQMTESRYNETFMDPRTKLFLTGPYPHRGVYHFCEELSCSPDEANFDKLIAWISKAKYNRPQDNMRALMKTMEEKEKAEQQERFDRMKEVLPAFGIRAANIGGRVKKTKTAPMMLSANELGLPYKGAKVMEVNRAV
jgi:hypothetical protein